jgi:hypothetical protein
MFVDALLQNAQFLDAPTIEAHIVTCDNVPSTIASSASLPDCHQNMFTSNHG